MKKTALIALAALATTTAFATMAPTAEDTVPLTADTTTSQVSVFDAPDVGSPTETVRILRRAAEQPVDATLPVYRGYEADWHQANDALIVRVVSEFNAEMGWTADHEDYLDAALVKAWALQESGGHERVFTAGDMMQMNNAGDWAAEKEWFGVQRGERLSPEESLRAALKWAYYKGEETRPMRGGAASDGWYATVRGGGVLPGYESRFTSWTRALTRYNGGGVADYHGDIKRRMATLG